MPCPPDRLSAPPGCSTQGVRSPAADFRRGAVLFVRRCGQTRRSCCPNQLVSPRAVLIYGALARLFHDVTGDRPTIQKDTQKAEHTHSVCSAEKDAQSPHRPPRSRANQRRNRGAQNRQARLINIGQSERSVLGHTRSKPALYQGTPSAIRPRVQLSGGRSLKINSHHAQPLSFEKIV